MNHKVHAILIPTLVSLLVIGCGLCSTGITPTEPPPAPTAIPATHTPRPTVAPESIPTSTPQPQPTPSPDARTEQLILSYQALVVISLNAEVLNDLATDVTLGLIGDMELPFLLLVVDDFLQGTDSLLAGMTPADALQPFWDDAVVNHETIKDVAARWEGLEIAAATVLAELAPVMEDMSDILSAAESTLIEEYGFEAQELTDYGDAAMGLIEFPEEPEQVTVGDDFFNLTNDNWYISDFDGLLNVVGLVESAYHAPLDMVEVTVTLLDADGEAVASQTLPTSLLLLDPGQISPFHVTFFDEVGEWDKYEITFSGREWDGLFPVYSDFEVFDTSWEIDAIFDALMIEGQIRNTGESTAETIFAAIVLYNAQGKVIGVGDGGLWDRDTLAPGEVAPFTGMVSEWVGEWDHYEFFFLAYPIR